MTSQAPLLLTPHAGELARLLTDLGHDTGRDAVEADPLTHARRAAEETGATVLLKGAVTLVVAAAEGPVLSQARGAVVAGDRRRGRRAGRGRR